MHNFDKIKYTIDNVSILDIEITKRYDRDGDVNLNIEQLSEEIKENGMHTEIWLNEQEDGKFLLISGKRRLAAHKYLGKKNIRAKIFKVENKMTLVYMAHNENSNRKNYNFFERLENFLRLVNLEYINKYQDSSSDFVASLVVRGIEKFVSRLAEMERDREHEKNRIARKSNIKYKKEFEPFTREEKSLEKIIKKVFDKSGLYSTYSTLNAAIKAFSIPIELRQFCTKYNLSIKLIYLLKKTEKEFEDKKLPVTYNQYSMLVNKNMLEKISKETEELIWWLNDLFDCINNFDKICQINIKIKEKIENFLSNNHKPLDNIEMVGNIKEYIQIIGSLLQDIKFDKSDANIQDSIQKIANIQKSMNINIKKVHYEDVSVMSCVMADIGYLDERSFNNSKPIVNKYKKIINSVSSKELIIEKIKEDFILVSDQVVGFVGIKDLNLKKKLKN